jgi:hypothetical protein
MLIRAAGVSVSFDSDTSDQVSAVADSVGRSRTRWHDRNSADRGTFLRKQFGIFHSGRNSASVVVGDAVGEQTRKLVA